MKYYIGALMALVALAQQQSEDLTVDMANAQAVCAG